MTDKPEGETNASNHPDGAKTAEKNPATPPIEGHKYGKCGNRERCCCCVAGDENKKSHWTTSRKLTSLEVSKTVVPLLVEGKLPVVIYGHIEYTDIFPNPKPNYALYYCTPFSTNDNPDDYDEACKDSNYIK